MNLISKYSQFVVQWGALSVSSESRLEFTLTNDAAASPVGSITFASVHCDTQLSWRGQVPEGVNCVCFLRYLFLTIPGWLSVNTFKHMHEWVDAYSVWGEWLRWLMQAINNINTSYKKDWRMLATERTLRPEDSAYHNYGRAVRTDFEEENSQRFVVRDC